MFEGKKEYRSQDSGFRIKNAAVGGKYLLTPDF